MQDNIIRVNPSDGVMAQVKKKQGKNHGIRHALTVEQQRAFISYVEKNVTFNHWGSLFKFLLGTGCRIGEAIGIRWEDVDFAKRTININIVWSIIVESIRDIRYVHLEYRFPKQRQVYELFQ